MGATNQPDDKRSTRSDGHKSGDYSSNASDLASNSLRASAEIDGDEKQKRLNLRRLQQLKMVEQGVRATFKALVEDSRFNRGAVFLGRDATPVT